MGILKTIWSWLTEEGLSPAEMEAELRAECYMLEARLMAVKESLRKMQDSKKQDVAFVKAVSVNTEDIINRRRAYAVAERLVEELRKKRGTPYTDAERAFLKSFAPKEDCRHLKGAPMRQLGADGRWELDKYAGSTGRALDYNVSDHTFPDRTRVIKCLICGEKRTKDSLDWKQWVEMAAQSSNRRSSSEFLVDL